MIWKHSPVVTAALKRDEEGRASTSLPEKVGPAEPGRVFRMKQNEQEEKTTPRKPTPEKQWRKPRENMVAQIQGI